MDSHCTVFIAYFTVSDCGPLDSPINGIVTTTGQKFWDSATYSCLPGYILVGEATRVCQDTGVWSLTAPACVGKCASLTFPTRNQVFTSMTPCHFLSAMECGNLNPPLDGPGFFQSSLVQATATYSCNVGFELVGEATRICLASGQWSDDEPQCQRV